MVLDIVIGVLLIGLLGLFSVGTIWLTIEKRKRNGKK